MFTYLVSSLCVFYQTKFVFKMEYEFKIVFFNSEKLLIEAGD